MPNKKPLIVRSQKKIKNNISVSILKLIYYSATLNQLTIHNKHNPVQ